MRSDRASKDTARHYTAVLVLLLLCSIVLYVQTHYQRTSASRPEDDYQNRIPQFHSSADRDDDGVDDQLDILNGALTYVSTHPKYKSRYYETGYPDDGYGVCTDVVAYALKNAGYDLQVLVNADIREQPQDYMVAVLLIYAIRVQRNTKYMILYIVNVKRLSRNWVIKAVRLVPTITQR